MNNFTPRAQQVLALARKEADRFNHNYVGTEHLLLGLIKLGQGVAVNVLQKMNLDLETVRLEVEKQVGNGPETKMVGNIPYTPRVKKVLASPARRRRRSTTVTSGRTHPPRPPPRGRRCRRPRPQEPRRRHRADPQRDPPRARPELLGNASEEEESDFEEPGAGNRKEGKTPALKAFGRDLTELANGGANSTP